MKYVIITGATKGIGKDVASELLKRGYYVIVTYAKDHITAKNVQAEFSLISENFEIHKVDQSKKEELSKFIEYIRKTFDHINCIVCNAGTTIRKKMLDISETDWEDVFQVSIHSHFYLIRDLFDKIPEHSRILFIGSLLGIYPHATSLPYGVSKAAVHALARNLVKEFEGTGTTVNTVVPGFVETEWQKDKPLHIRENIYKKTAIKRFAEVGEITSACLFCIDNGFVNGALIEVSGGYSFK